MNKKNSKNCALITGSSARLGFKTAEALLKEGYDVIIHDHPKKKEKIKKAEKDLKNRFPERNIRAITGDLSSEKAIINIFKKIKDNGEIISILINNASVFSKSNFKNINKSEIEKTLMVNSIAPLLLMKEFAKNYKKGLIINILDSRIRWYDSEHFSYQVSKSLLKCISEFAAKELAPGFRVNSIAPGLILAPGNKSASYLENLKSRNLLKKTGTVSDFIKTIVFIIDNSFITGETIYVDGHEIL